MRTSRQLLRLARASTLRRQAPTTYTLTAGRVGVRTTSALPSLISSKSSQQSSPFSTATVRPKGLQPDSSDPEPPKTEASHEVHAAAPAQISDAEYHEIADQYLNTLVLSIEELAEKNTDGLEAEFSAGVLTITHPSNGTYVLNKQPVNRQIWLSSPVSGPKRYDWVIPSASQHHKEDSVIDAGDHEESASGGKWIYLRDGSSLSEVLKKELDVEVAGVGDEDAVTGKDGPAQGGVNSAP